ncbi:hypothetical protein Vadar_022185 [Vaccinium darrowii]|uniref:Uncharacterized protein n=1 Tax=Vaccinium darrowii TaxID=229202 RepID=A0ACB7Y9L1_9ERIC|nr:hypothetical protein Vadar_022185 [Vaccinium darrowii]
MERKGRREDFPSRTKETIASEKPDSQGWTNYICFNTETVDTGRMDFYAVPIGYTYGSHGSVVNYFDPASYNPRSLTTAAALKPFYSSTAIPKSATFVASGSSLFCIGGVVFLPEFNQKPSSTMYRLEKTTGSSSTNKGGFFCSKTKMLSPRDRSSAIAMGGKLYIIGGYTAEGSHEVSGGHWAEVFDPYSESSLPLPPPPLVNIEDKFDIVTAALHSSKQIFVASRQSNVAYLYDVVEGIWEKLDIRTDLSSFVVGQAAVVGKATLCWYQDGTQQLVAYDLDLKMWFRHRIRGLEKFGKRCSRFSPCLSSLLSLDGDHLCLIWRDCMMPHPRTGGPVFHFTKVHVSIRLDARGKPILDAFAISSKSCVLKQNASLCSALTHTE